MSYPNDLEPKLEECREIGFHTADECPTILHTKRVHCHSGDAPPRSWRTWALSLAGFAGAFGGGFLASNLHTIHHITHAVLRFFGIACP